MFLSLFLLFSQTRFAILRLAFSIMFIMSNLLFSNKTHNFYLDPSFSLKALINNIEFNLRNKHTKPLIICPTSFEALHTQTHTPTHTRTHTISQRRKTLQATYTHCLTQSDKHTNIDTF